VATEVTNADNEQGDSGREDGDEESGIETRHDEIPEDKVYHDDSMTPSVQRIYGPMPRNPRGYIHMYAHATVMHHAMTHYSLRKGLKKFRKVGEDAISKELKQRHTRDTFMPQYSKTLSDEHKRGALESFMFIKEKRDGSIKGRACTDGRKQSKAAVPMYDTSPTVTLEAVLITATIDAFE
jgi:hypothetical protein